MATDRTQDLVLRANVDQALGPLSQVTQRVKDLISVINAQGDAAKTGNTTIGEYSKALKDLVQASGDLLKARSALDNFQKRADTDSARQATVDTRRQARDAYAASIPGDGGRTAAQETALAKLNAALASSVRLANASGAAYAKAAEQLQIMGVLAEKLDTAQQRQRLDAANAHLSDTILQANQALPGAKAQGDQLVQTLRNAGIEKQVAEQRAKDNARELADQAKLEQQRQRAIVGVVQQQQSLRATDDAAADRVRSTGATRQLAVDQGTAVNRRKEDVEAALQAQDREKALAAQRDKDALAFQAMQVRLRQAVQETWDAEDAGAAKARTSFESFQAQVAKGVSGADAAAARVAGQTAALGRPTAPAAPTLAETVRGTLATPPGPGTGTSNLTGLQSEVARISASLTSGSGSIEQYSAALRALDAVANETFRQSKIVDSFIAQRTATEAAIQTYKEAEAELLRLKDSLNGVADKEELSEVTSQIAALQKRIGSEGGNGLAAAVRSNVDALETERAKLASIGVAMTDVTEATNKLTQVAVQAADARTQALARERAEIARVAGETKSRQEAVSARVNSGVVNAPSPSAQSVVADKFAAVPDRSGLSALGDATEAADKLQGTLATGAVTAGTYQHNMEKVYAVQRLIAGDAGLIDSFREQQEATTRASEAFRVAEAELQRLVAEAQKGTVGLAELSNAERRFNAATANLDAQNAKQAQLAAQMKTRKIDTDDLTAATDRLAAAAAKAASVQGGIKSSGFLGLQPYQLKNLEYQIGDIYTQLSLGQGFFRTFNAQADQVFQLWDISISKLRLIVLYGAPAAAALGLVYEAMSQAAETVTAQREFAAQLAAASDGAAYQATKLVALQRTVEKMGVSWTDAGMAIRQFMQQDFSTNQIERLSQIAQGLVDLYGIKFVDALKMVTTVATGTFDEIQKLNESNPANLRFLSPDQQEATRKQFDAGNPDTARAIPTAALEQAARHGIEAVHPLTLAFRDLTNAWHDFSRSLDAEPGVHHFNDTLKETVEGVAHLIEMLSRPIDTPFLKDMPGQMKAILAQEAEILSGLTLWKTLLGQLPGGKSEVTSGNEPGGVKIGDGGDAIGMFQLHKPAAQDVGLTSEDRYDYTKNIQGGVDYFKLMLDKMGDLFGATRAFNQGTGNANTYAGAAYGRAVAAEDTSGIDPKVLADITAAFDRTFKGYTGDRDAALQRVLQIAVHESGASQYNPGAVPGKSPPEGPQPPQSGSTANEAQNKQALDALNDRLKEQRDRNLVDNDARAQITAQGEALRKQLTTEATSKVTAPGGLSAEVKAGIEANVNFLVQKLTETFEKREKSEEQAQKDRLLELKAQADRADKTDPVKQREAVNIQFDKQIEDAQKTARQGGQEALGPGGMDAVVASINKMRNEALEKATIDADEAIVTAIVKTRDDKVKEVVESVKTGGTTADQAFTKLAAIIAEFAPRVKAAVDTASNDLRSRPQTPGTEAALAKVSAQGASIGGTVAKETDDIAYKQITDLIAARNDKVKTYNDLVGQGASTQNQADAASVKAYADARTQLDPLIAGLQTQLNLQRQLGQITPETYEKMTAQLKEATAASNDLTKSQKQVMETLEGDVVSDAIRGFETIATALGNVVAGTGNWAQVLQSVGRAFANFASDILKQIAEMIIKQTILNALQSGAESGTGVGGAIKSFASYIGGGAAAAGGGAAAATTAATTLGDLYHTGGIVGAGGMSRTGFNPALWAAAPRLHDGGLVGLSSGEVPAILQNGEEVLSASDARNRNNASPEVTSGSPQSIRNVLVMNSKDLSQAMAGSHGEKVVLTHIKNNPGAVRSILNI